MTDSEISLLGARRLMTRLCTPRQLVVNPVRRLELSAELGSRAAARAGWNVRVVATVLVMILASVIALWGGARVAMTFRPARVKAP